MKAAIVTAALLEVCCPTCGEPQPAPDDGAGMWLPRQITAVDGRKHTCVACDDAFTILSQNKVTVSK